MTTEKPFALLGAENWQSYAYFRTGVRYEEGGNKRAARNMYYRALASSPTNLGACLNLAILDIYADPKDEERDPHALSLLEYVKERAQAAESMGENISTSPPWYVATYQLAATHDYQDQVQPAYEQSCALVEKISKTIEILEKTGSSSLIPWRRRREESKYEEILQFLSELRPLAVIMLAAILLRQEGKGAAEEQRAVITAHELTHPRVRYNVACYFSRLGECERGEAREEAYKSALNDLRYAFERKRELVEHARTDVSLRGVRKAKSGDFNSLIKRYARSVLPQPSDQLYLAGVEIVGETHAKQLMQHDIVSSEDLVSKAATPAARRRLSGTTGISLKLLQRWALLADMMRVIGTDIPQANLMVAADVASLRTLRKSEPEKLAIMLHQVNEARSLVKQPPELATVRKWVQEAAMTKRKVKLAHFAW